MRARRRKLLVSLALSCTAVQLGCTRSDERKLEGEAPEPEAVEASPVETPDKTAQSLNEGVEPQVTGQQDLSLTDPETKRKIGLRVRLPQERTPTGLILYSPGLGSGVSNGAAWCEAWRRAGFVVVTLAHPVTDDSLWNTKKQSFKANLNDALAAQQYGLRVKDCSFVITQCLKHPDIAPYVDPERIGIAGHSYGALTVQSIAGQPLGGQDVHDPRIKAAIALSPSALSAERAKGMSKVQIPFFSITGDHDNYVTFTDKSESMRLGLPLANRRLVNEYVPAGLKQLAVFEQADHMSFAGEPINAKHFSRDLKNITPQSEQALWTRVSEVTTAFWNYYLASGYKPDTDKRAEYQQATLKLKSEKDQLTFG